METLSIYTPKTMNLIPQIAILSISKSKKLSLILQMAIPFVFDKISPQIHLLTNNISHVLIPQKVNRNYIFNIYITLLRVNATITPKNSNPNRDTIYFFIPPRSERFFPNKYISRRKSAESRNMISVHGKCICENLMAKLAARTIPDIDIWVVLYH